MTRGRLIVLEGGEGAGKSTQAAFIAGWLAQRGRNVLRTREPGGSPRAEALRAQLLGGAADAPDAVTELLLMFAARADHLRHAIRPALAAGTDVVCDRFVDSSYAYQGAGRGVPAAAIDALARLVLGDLAPDLVIVLDLPPSQGLQRARARGDANRFEGEALAFQERVRACFLARAAAAPVRYAVVDAAAGLDAVRAQLAQVLEQRLAVPA